MSLSFASDLDRRKATNTANYVIKTWDLKRSSNYGSDRYSEQILPISKAELLEDGKSVSLSIEHIRPVDVMSISYDISNVNKISFKGTVQSTIHNLGAD